MPDKETTAYNNANDEARAKIATECYPASCAEGTAPAIDAEVEQAAETAAESGSRKDLLRYLKLRRKESPDPRIGESAEAIGTGAMMKPPQTALDVQVDGEHYKNLAIQPMEIAHANKLSAWEYDALKYLLRHRVKGGKTDLHKCMHCINLGLELEYGNA